MQTELDRNRKLLQSVSTNLKRCKTPTALRVSLTHNDISISTVLSWHNRFPEPVIAPTARYNKKQIAARRKAKENKQLSDILKHASKWLSNYATWRASMIGHDQIPEIVKAAVFAINNALIYRPVSLMRAAKLSREPLVDADQLLHGFWEQVIFPSIKSEFGDRFNATDDDPFKPVCDRIAATEILAEFVEGGTDGVETKLAATPSAAVATMPAAPNESSVVDLRHDGDHEAKHLHGHEKTQVQSGTLIVDKKALEVRWNNHRLDINRSADFRVISVLWERRGELVPHEDLFYAIKPHEKPGDGKHYKMKQALPEVKTAIQNIRAALKKLNAGNPIETLKSLGYMLRFPDA